MRAPAGRAQRKCARLGAFLTALCLVGAAMITAVQAGTERAAPAMPQMGAADSMVGAAVITPPAAANCGGISGCATCRDRVSPRATQPSHTCTKCQLPGYNLLKSDGICREFSFWLCRVYCCVCARAASVVVVLRARAAPIAGDAAGDDRAALSRATRTHSASSQNTKHTKHKT